MITTVISFLPFTTCLFWLVLNPLLHKNDKAFRTLEFLLVIAGIVSLSQASIACSDGKTMMSFFLIRQFITPLLIPAVMLYTNSLLPDNHPKPAIQAWIAVPISLLFAETILIMLSGTDGFIDAICKTPAGGRYDRIVNMIHLCSFWVFYSVLAVQVLLWIIVTVTRVIKGYRNIQLLNCSVIILLFTAWEIATLAEVAPTITAIISILLSCAFFFTAYKGVFNYHTSIRISETQEQDDTEDIPHESDHIMADIHLSQADEDNLRIRFEDLIVTEQLFLKQGIRISDIASMLQTNRTYVSRLVNNTYNMSFSDYINTLRIDYAEQYLMHHKDAKQSDIAAACGFPNASAFNNVFKKITGVTPKIWLATRS